MCKWTINRDTKEHPFLWQNLIRTKYQYQFYFYFAKPINEILAGVTIPHVIYYKDLLFDDPDTEYLNRIYYKMEVKPRLKYLGEIYKDFKKPIANICVSDVQ